MPRLTKLKSKTNIIHKIDKDESIPTLDSHK